jgi:hypothetical protein
MEKTFYVTTINLYYYYVFDVGTNNFTELSERIYEHNFERYFLQTLLQVLTVVNASTAI